MQKVTLQHYISGIPEWALALLPELGICVLLVLVLLVDWLMPRWRHRTLAVAVPVCLIVILAMQLGQRGERSLQSPQLFDGFLVQAQATFFLRQLILLLAVLVSVFAGVYRPLRELGLRKTAGGGTGEFYFLLLTTVLAALLLVQARNLILLFILMELLSLPSYVLVGYFRRGVGSAEASVKYLLFGSVSSGLFLYGLTLLYGQTGTLAVEALGELKPGLSSWVALSFVLVGIAFKLSAAPLHFWAPDAYEGSATPVAALLATVSKVAAVGLLLVQAPIVYHVMPFWMVAMSALALTSLVIGTFGALQQNNYKRLLAYSGVSQMGFLLLGFATSSVMGWAAALAYLLMYTLVTVGLFLAAQLLAEAAGSADIQQWKGLAKRHPVLAAALTVLLVASVGLPPTFGFIAKLNLFLSLYEGIQAGGPVLFLVLLVAGLLATVVSLYFYLRPVSVLFFQQPETAGNWRSLTAAGHRLQYALAVLLAGLVLVLGVYGFDMVLNTLRAMVEVQ